MGAGYATVKRGVMTVTRSIDDLDAILAPVYDPDVQHRMKIMANTFDFVPYKRSVYKRLLEEGAAPAPQNKYQEELLRQHKNTESPKPR